MGGHIIKAARNLDLYAEWRGIADGPPSVIGTREEMLRHLNTYRDLTDQASGSPEQRLARADEVGSSAQRAAWDDGDDPLTGWWGDPGFVVAQRGWLPRARLPEFLEACRASSGTTNLEQAYSLLEPFDDGTPS
ncbi:hypothetical protein LZ318_30820 [Saccharopolyspora indica]|uniref:hypothetical protein n=1 Tax=Saccharopolyspora indica TaxID=1229659 RepID=UPI0022EA581F|nr:hypothetical protein [Saccharopolyspora indica]MDA3644374.1 hypothetical protein [Saccharopolyspora indica]